MSTSNFLNLSDTGRNDRWRYLLSFIIIGVFNAIYFSIMHNQYRNFILTGNLKTNNIFYVKLMHPLIAGILMLFALLIIMAIHRRSMMTLISTDRRLSLRQYTYAFFIYMGLMIMIKLILIPLHIAKVFWQNDLSLFLIQGIVALFVLLLQTTVEEMLFRGYLLQSFGRWITNPYILSCIISVLFLVVHFSTSMPLSSMVFYFLWSFLLTLITIRSNRLELAMGIHCAHNMYVFWVSPLLITNDVVKSFWPLVSLIPVILIYCMVIYKQYRLRK